MIRRNLVNTINKKYVGISNRMTEAYTPVFGLPCDLYFPIWDKYSEEAMYKNMEIFTPHQSPTYRDTPDVRTKFYIPQLIKKQAMNSAEAEFDAFYTEDESLDRPFIETSKSRELPIGTKVVVHQGESISKFMVDKKLVVTGANGMMLLRMYLDPLAKDSDEDNTEAENQEESIEGEEENDYTYNCGCLTGDEDCDCGCLHMNIPEEDEDNG